MPPRPWLCCAIRLLPTKINDAMSGSVIFRFIVLGLLWLALVGTILVRTPKITLYTLFVIVASAIIIFVPVYKKYVKNDNSGR